jgi:hypothetical protein
LFRSTKSSQENPFESLRAGFGVAGLGCGGGQVEAQRVRVVFAQKVGHLDGGAATLAQLRALEIEVFMVTRDKNLPF